MTIRAVWLAALAVLFLIGFSVQRARSPFLRIEREYAVASRVAAASGLQVAEVMALRELAGVDTPEPEVERRALEFVRMRREHSRDELAALVFMQRRDLVVELLATAHGDVAAACDRLKPMPEGLYPVRFAAMQERFADRLRAAIRAGG